MVLLWFYYGIIMVVLWFYYGIIMLLLWFYCCICMVLLWFYYGILMVLAWYYYGIIAVLLLCYYGSSVFLQWFYYGFIMAPSWWYYGIIVEGLRSFGDRLGSTPPIRVDPCGLRFGKIWCGPPAVEGLCSFLRFLRHLFDTVAPLGRPWTACGRVGGERGGDGGKLRAVHTKSSRHGAHVGPPEGGQGTHEIPQKSNKRGGPSATGGPH
jgi:hypothetical protein